LIRTHKKTQAIGVFDSGIGGLTVANAIISQLPKEEIIYFGDTAHLPYGDKSADAIRYYSLKIVKFLLEKQCKMIVIACNSASAAAYKTLLDFYEGQVFFINVIDPLVEIVAQQDYQKVGVIATKATIRSNIYKHKLLEAKPSLKVESLATPLLVPMIEEGYSNDNISDAIIEKYLSNPAFQGIDALLLACTHYPLIRKKIEAYFNHKVTVYDSTGVVIEAIRKRLKAFDLLNDSEDSKAPHFFVSDYTQSFEETTNVFYKEQIQLEYCPIW